MKIILLPFQSQRFGNQLLNRLLNACASAATVTYAQLSGLASP
jgi:hypothetical protein